MFGLTADDFLAIARDRTQLTDFGDERFLPAFRRMIAAINAQTRFSTEGRELAKERFLRLLVNRLRFNADLEAHPEILEQPILPPLVILGMPRTGSTKLHRMLGYGEDFRSMLMWQGYNPAPFPDAPAHGPDPRIEAAAQFLAWRASRHAGISAAHHAAAQEPEEEVYLVEMSFANWAAGGYYEMPSYIEWVRSVDRDYVYVCVHQMLQYLEWQHHRASVPRPWILKTPPNLGHEAAMLANFPGARFVMLHRDPLEAVPSLISLTNAMRHQYLAEPPCLPDIAAWLLEESGDILDRHMAWRDRTPDAPVIDVAYREVVEDDMNVVRRIYDFCGMTLEDRSRRAMEGWSQENRQHRHGEHRYSLEGTGLTEREIRARLEPYCRRFGNYL
jgi:hypothetical protein